MKTRRIERLNDAQVIDLLSLALPAQSAGSALVSMFRSLVEKPASALLQEARERMSKHGFGVAEAADLLGVSELTVRRWFEIADDLPSAVKHKLAGLCLLLSWAHDVTEESEVTQRLRCALSIAKSGSPGDDAELLDASARVIASIFGAAGVAATALRAMLDEESVRVKVYEVEGVGNAPSIVEQP